MRSRRDQFHSLHDALEQLVDRIAALAQQLDYEDVTAAAPDPKRRERARQAELLTDDATATWDTFGELLADWDDDGDRD